MSELPRFTTLRVARPNALAIVTIDHPPLNLMDVAMLDEPAGKCR